jgi:hypothetical protein
MEAYLQNKYNSMFKYFSSFFLKTIWLDFSKLVKDKQPSFFITPSVIKNKSLEHWHQET